MYIYVLTDKAMRGCGIKARRALAPRAKFDSLDLWLLAGEYNQALHQGMGFL